MSRYPLAFLLLTLFFPLAFAPAHLHAKGSSSPDNKEARKAAKRQAQQDALDAMRRGEILPLMRILAIANQHVAGDVIEVEYKAGPAYEIKVLMPSGQVREVKLDARTGALLKIEDD